MSPLTEQRRDLINRSLRHLATVKTRIPRGGRGRVVRKADHDAMIDYDHMYPCSRSCSRLLENLVLPYLLPG